MKSALVHYWLTNRRGGEAVLEAIAELLPGSRLYSHVIDQAALFGALKGLETTETFVGRLPFSRSHYQMYLPLMPLALENLDMSGYDLIVSSEAGPAKWVIPAPHARHICYCHSPLRYIWDQRQIYMQQIPQPARMVAQAYAGGLRRADVISAARVDTFVANSNFVADRIWRYYKREAQVIAPPVSVDEFKPTSGPKDFYLVAGEIRKYKRIDVAVQACTALGRQLVVIGGGRNISDLRRMAGPTVKFLGRTSQADLRQALADCRALLFPGVEDFGIVPVEAMASGRPVIAYGVGGVLDSVVDGVTGLLYQDPSVEGLKRAILAFEAEEQAFTAQACVDQAKRFDRSVFQAKFSSLLASPDPGRP